MLSEWVARYSGIRIGDETADLMDFDMFVVLGFEKMVRQLHAAGALAGFQDHSDYSASNRPSALIKASRIDMTCV